MKTAEIKLNQKIESLDDKQILAALRELNGPWELRSPEKRMVRVRLLNEYENRHGGKAVDLLMDILDRAAEMATA